MSCEGAFIVLRIMNTSTYEDINRGITTTTATSTTIELERARTELG
jgi:hypothetical protein